MNRDKRHATFLILLAPVVQTLDSGIHWISHYPADTVSIKKTIRDLSSEYTWGVIKTKTLVN